MLVEYFDVDEKLPNDGDYIEGMNAEGMTWREYWDSTEPLGLMVQWRLIVPKERLHEYVKHGKD